MWWSKCDIRITFKGRHSSRCYIKTVRTSQWTLSASVRKTKVLNHNNKRSVNTTILHRKHTTYFGSLDPSAGVHKFDIYRKMHLITLNQRIEDIWGRKYLITVFPKLRRATIRFVSSVSLSVCLSAVCLSVRMEQLAPHWMDFSLKLILELISSFVEGNQF